MVIIKKSYIRGMNRSFKKETILYLIKLINIQFIPLVKVTKFWSMCISTSIERERLAKIFLKYQYWQRHKFKFNSYAKKMVKYNFVVDNYDFVNWTYPITNCWRVSLLNHCVKSFIHWKVMNGFKEKLIYG